MRDSIKRESSIKIIPSLLPRSLDLKCREEDTLTLSHQQRIQKVSISPGGMWTHCVVICFDFEDFYCSTDKVTSVYADTVKVILQKVQRSQHNTNFSISFSVFSHQVFLMHQLNTCMKHLVSVLKAELIVLLTLRVLIYIQFI